MPFQFCGLENLEGLPIFLLQHLL